MLARNRPPKESQRHPDRTDSADPLFDRWPEVDALFQAVLARPPDERDAFLLAACGEDETLHRLVTELLAAGESGRSVLEERTRIIREPLSTLEGDAPPSAQESDLGRQVGRYQLLQEIGRGGTGTVYRAERVDGAFEQQVAIKLLRRGLDTEEILARFRAERQILASLNHPNIARLIDGGTTDDGRPYLVMELVEGTPITEYCEAERLTVDDRLRLFISVGRAVEYAHRKLVVHRDLKPSNILVTAEGSVKLLDFGIAKLLDPATAVTDSSRTHTGMRMLTPEYASPEQLRGEPISTTSDIYQLGVLLCLLLTGARPHPPNRHRMDVLGPEGPPLVPSTLVARAPQAGDTPGGAVDIARFAAACRTDPRRLRRRLRGDLDTIILVSLREEPERRYPAVVEFVADIERHLAGLPVQARPDRWTYRARKFIVRRPGWTAALAAMPLLAGIYIFTVAHHAERVEIERDRALVESAKLQRLTDFLIELFAAGDPDRPDAEMPSALDLVRRGEESLGELDDQPEIQAQVLSVMGTLYVQLGEYERAEPLLREALTLLRSEAFGSEVETARALVRFGDMLNRRGRPAEAEPLLHEAIAIARHTGEMEIEADAHTGLGHARYRAGDHRSAEPSFRDALALYQQALGDAHRKTFDGMHNLANVLLTTGRFEEAEGLFLQALTLKRELLHPTHSSTAATLTALANLYSWTGDNESAESLLREVVSTRQSRLGPDHPSVGDALVSFGEVLIRRGDYVAAEEVLRGGLEITSKTVGREHAYISGILALLGRAIREQGRVNEAIDLYRESAAIARNQWGDSHFTTANVVYNLGSTLLQSGADVEAETLFRESVAIFDRARPDGHPQAAYPLTSLGELLLRQGRTAEAEALLQRALELYGEYGGGADEIARLERLLDSSGGQGGFDRLTGFSG